MKKSAILILLSLILASCMNGADLNVTFKKIVNSAIKKSGGIVQSFGEQGSLSLTYSDLKEDVLANFKPINYHCLPDLSCIYHTRVKLTGSTDEFDYLVKVNSQFQIDTSFGVNGYLLLASVDLRMGNPLFGFFSLLGINSADGKMYIGFGNGVARLLPNGKLDVTFGNKGIFIMDRTVYNYFPSKIIQSNLDELLILTAIAPGGGSLSSGNFGSVLLSVSKDGAFKNINEFNNNSLITYKLYNSSFAYPKDIGEMLIIDNAGLNETYYAYMSSNFLRVHKTNMDTTAVAGFNFPGGGYNTTSSDYRVKKLFEVGSEIYVFMTAPTSELYASKLIVFDKTTGAINAAKTKSFTNGAIPLVLDDVIKSSGGFVLSLKQCIIVQFSNDCGRANRFAAQIDASGTMLNLVSIASSNGAETDNIGHAQTFLQKRNMDFYALNFSPQFLGPLGESYTRLSVKKFDELMNIDNTFGGTGEVTASMAYTVKLSFVNLADKILLDDNINSYYLVNYEIGLKKVHKIIKLDKNMNAVTTFGNAGSIDLANFSEVNTIELDEVNKRLYVVYTIDNAGNREVYIRRYDMLTGVIDVGFGTTGELFVYSTVGSSAGYASYYNGQVIKPVNVLDPHSYILKDGFVLTLQTPQDRSSFRVYKFDFTTELLNSRVLTSADYPASANYTISEILNISITKNESIFVTAKFVGDPGIYHGEILKLSNSNFSTDTTFGTNGFMFINGGTSNISGSGMDISAREVIKVTDDYIYLMKQAAYVEQDVNGNFLKYQVTPGYQRLSYSGLSDTAFENSMAQRAEAYRIQFNGGKTNFALVQSVPISKSHNYFTVFMFGIYANDMAEYISLSSDTTALYSTIHIATIKFEFKDHESFTDTIFKSFPFLDFMNGEITDESFLLQEMYSFDKGEYVYKVAISSLDDQGQPIFKLFKLYN